MYGGKRFVKVLVTIGTIPHTPWNHFQHPDIYIYIYIYIYCLNLPDSEWTPWSSWSSCSPAFNGTRQRTRQCRRVSSKSVLESVHCRGVAKEVESCPPFLCTGNAFIIGIFMSSCSHMQMLFVCLFVCCFFQNPTIVQHVMDV